MSLQFPYNSEINSYKYENNYVNTKIYIYDYINRKNIREFCICIDYWINYNKYGEVCFGPTIRLYKSNNYSDAFRAYSYLKISEPYISKLCFERQELKSVRLTDETIYKKLEEFGNLF